MHTVFQFSVQQYAPILVIVVLVWWGRLRHYSVFVLKVTDVYVEGRQVTPEKKKCTS